MDCLNLLDFFLRTFHPRTAKLHSFFKSTQNIYKDRLYSGPSNVSLIKFLE